MLPLVVYGHGLTWRGPDAPPLAAGMRSCDQCASPADKDLRSLLGTRDYGQVAAPAEVIALAQDEMEVKTFSPIAAGSEVWLAGELHGINCCAAVRGRARVVECRLPETGAYHLRLALLQVAYGPLPGRLLVSRYPLRIVERLTAWLGLQRRQASRHRGS